jgi:hypothetical protein
MLVAIPNTRRSARVNLDVVELAIADATSERVCVAGAVGPRRFDIRFRASTPLFVGRSDALVPLGLLAAMRTGMRLVIPGTVSSRLLEHAGTAQDLLESFSGGALARTEIVAEPASVVDFAPRGVGAFFSGGVDSFYTLLQHQAEITHLIFVRGLENAEPGSRRDRAATDAAHEIARVFDKELIDIETNLRVFTEPFAQWTLAFGSVLGALALLLQSKLTRIYVAAGSTYETLGPWGSHPLLDPLWGTEALEIVHDGCEATRGAKVARIASSRPALEHLRVCTRQHATYNCGVCEKCVRTMVNLRVSGALGQCPTLPDTVDLRRVASQRLSSNPVTTFARESFEEALRARDWRLALALRASLRPHPVRAARHRLGRLRRALRRRARRGGSIEPAAVR